MERTVNTRTMERFAWVSLIILLYGILLVRAAALASPIDTSPPSAPVKLIFIHHSCGENWLSDGNGGLARALQQNNYFVSDTNYGWGPDGIGDRTDITNWPEWFVESNSGAYLRALFSESGIHSPYRRTLKDPGGENQIIMFKSCFPNSNLGGRPQDPPRRGSGLTVANAKAIYNDLLTFFASRPDKLFIAVTAPPVQDSSHGRNARAFNNWLVNDWLRNYKGQNVAVFDFYNVLTGRNNHHQVKSGLVEHTSGGGRNTLAYASDPGDDHPNTAGNRKATADFVPLLNVYYHQWQASSPPASPATPAHIETPGAPAAASVEPAPPTSTKPPAARPSGNVIDDFETSEPKWQVFLDGQSGTRLVGQKDTSRAHSGKTSMNLDYQVGPDGWAIYSLVYPSFQDWSKASGLVVHIHADQPGRNLSITAYNGESTDSLRHFEYHVTTNRSAVKGWQRIPIPWNKMKQPSWEGDGSTRFDPSRSLGMAIIFSANTSGRIWVDDLRLLP
jgi:hypothetical protein